MKLLFKFNLVFILIFALGLAATAAASSGILTSRGRHCAVRIAPSHNTSECSMAFCSSRTFPGQSYTKRLSRKR